MVTEKQREYYKARRQKNVNKVKEYAARRRAKKQETKQKSKEVVEETTQEPTS